MTPLEAMTTLIESVRRHLGEGDDIREHSQDAREVQALDVVQRMLDTAIPIARFRCFIEFTPRKRGAQKIEFTICSPNIEGITSALAGVGLTPKGLSTGGEIYATLWEQQVTKAEMISGFQGPLRSRGYITWFYDLRQRYAEAEGGPN